MIYSFRAVWFVMSACVSRMEHSTIVEGQRLGTVYIMEGTCSGLRFFMRIEQKVTPTCTYTHTDTCACACTCVCVFFFLLCGAASRRVSRVVVGWVVGCGVVLSTCHCRGGLCPHVVVPLIASS